MDRQRKYFIITIAFSLFVHVVFGQDRIDKNCNPGIRHRFDDCPKGYCCVRDEFLPTYVYCRKIGAEDDNCTTKDTDSECPCAEGLVCKANIISSFVSLYGRCHDPSKDVTTTSTPTPTTTTTTTTTMSTTASFSGAADLTNFGTRSSAATTGTTGDTNQKLATSATTAGKHSHEHTTRPIVDFPMPIIG